MIATKLLQQIDENFDNFKHLACENICLDLNRIRNCGNTNPVTRYICHKYSYMYKYISGIHINIIV